MENTLVQFFTTQWPAIAILSIWGYFLVKYFMSQLEKKDWQNQCNLDRYIGLSEKTMEIMQKFSNSLDWLHPKLNEIHEDIREIKNRK